MGDAPPPEARPIGVFGWCRALLRAGAMLGLILTGLFLLLILRLIERPAFAPGRPVTPWITVAVCRGVLWLMGLKLRVKGTQMRRNGAVVSNHVSWLDILVLNSRRPVYFVAKSEVARWPGIGWLARATGTVFIRRDRREAGAQVTLFKRRLGAGHRLLFFPEGTSTDGQRVLPFKTTLFAAFFDPSLHETMFIQPVSVIYRAPPGQDPRFFGWWGDMNLGGSLAKVLAQAPQGHVELVYHAPLRVAGYQNRKALARALEERVRAPVAPAAGGDAA